MKSRAEMDALVWSIGELAERFGLETHVLRHWESQALLQPERTAAAGAATARRTPTGSP